MSATLPLAAAAALPKVDLSRAPRVSTTLAAALAAYAALFPSLLPHGPLLQGTAMAVFLLVTLAVVRRLRPGRPRFGARGRAVAVGSAVPLFAGAAWWEVATQNAQRQAMGAPVAGPWHWLVSAAVALLLVGVVRAVGWAVRNPRRSWRPVLGATVSALVLVPAVGAHAAGVGGSDRVLERESPAGAVRVYAAQRDGESLGQRASRAAEQLVEAGGLTRDRVVVMVPTGSGWVDPAAVDGFEARFGQDVAMVGMQYAATPSWFAYLFQRSSAEDGARALLDAVTERIEALPAAKRPLLHVYGESLGAMAGQAALRAPGRAAAVCSSLWVGSPGGATAGVGAEGQVANTDDPVVHATPSLAVHPTVDGAPWLPGISYAQAAFDFVGSLGVPEGHGHRYGPDQVAALPDCGPAR